MPINALFLTLILTSGQLIATVGGDKFIRVWGLLDRELIATIGLSNIGNAVDWSIDGRVLAGEKYQ